MFTLRINVITRKHNSSMEQHLISEQSDFFITQKSNSPFLKKYIAYYYFHKCEKKLQTQYLYHPHYKKALSIYKNSIIKWQGDNSWTIPAPESNPNYFYFYESIQKTSKHVFLQAPFDKIGIVFHPLGINHFINQPLSTTLKQFQGQSFSYFDSSIKYYLDSIYQSKDIHQKVLLLDTYFTTLYVGFNETRLVKAIHLLTYKNPSFTVSELASILQINRKTLFRLFKKHLACSVKDYIHTVRFRKALLIYQKKKSSFSLTDLAYESDFYDQSEFIHHFKRLTGFNPKKFFREIKKFGNEDTMWTLPSNMRPQL